MVNKDGSTVLYLLAWGWGILALLGAGKAFHC